LQYSAVIMICILIANGIKLTCMILVLKLNFEPVLATIGDGIASFLERTDATTIERPFMSRNDAKKFKPLAPRTPKRWQKGEVNHRWWKAPSRTRWMITLIL
jgi:hypothetical protein